MKALSAINSTNPCLPKTHFLKVPIFHPFFKFNPFSHSYNTHAHAANRAHKLPLTISCKLKSSQDVKNKGKSVSQKIVLSETSPPPLTEDDGTNSDSGDVPQSSMKKKGGPFEVLIVFRRKTLQILSSLPLAIADMFVAAALMALGMHNMLHFSSSLSFHCYQLTTCYLCFNDKSLEYVSSIQPTQYFVH